MKCLMYRVRKMLPWILGKITSDNGDGNCEGNLE